MKNILNNKRNIVLILSVLLAIVVLSLTFIFVISKNNLAKLSSKADSTNQIAVIPSGKIIDVPPSISLYYNFNNNIFTHSSEYVDSKDVYKSSNPSMFFIKNTDSSKTIALQFGGGNVPNYYIKLDYLAPDKITFENSTYLIDCNKFTNTHDESLPTSYKLVSDKNGTKIYTIVGQANEIGVEFNGHGPFVATKI